MEFVWIGKLVIFVNIASLRFNFSVDWIRGVASDEASRASRVIGYLQRTLWNQPLVANFFAYFKPAQRLKSRDILYLVCCPEHIKEKVRQEHDRQGRTLESGISRVKIIPEDDQVFVLLSGGISPAEDLKDFYLRLVLH